MPARFLYSLDLPLKDKIACICKEVYGADGVDFSEAAEVRLQVRNCYLSSPCRASRYMTPRPYAF